MIKILFTCFAALLLSACASTPLTGTYDSEIIKGAMKPATTPVLFSLPDSHPVALAIKKNGGISPLGDGKIYVSDVRAVLGKGYGSFSENGTVYISKSYHLDGAQLAANLKQALNELLSEQGALATSPQEADMLLDIALVDVSKDIYNRLQMKFEVKSAPSSGQWNKQIKFEIPRIARDPDCYYCSHYSDTSNYIRIASDHSTMTSVKKQVSERFGELFGLLLTDVSLAKEYYREGWKVTGLGLNAIAQGRFASAADQHKKAAETEQLQLQAKEQERQERLNQLGAFIRERPDLHDVYTRLVNQGATCNATSKLSSSISDFSCGGMTEGRLREYYKSPECDAIQAQAVPMIRQDSDRICNSYRTGRKDFTNAFGSESSLAEALFYRAVQSQGRSASLQGYESVLTSLRQANETAKSNHESSIENNYRNNMDSVANKMRSAGSSSTAADRIVQQSVRSTQTALASMALLQTTRIPKVDLRALNLRMSNNTALQNRTAAAGLSADQQIKEAEASCMARGGRFTVNQQTKNHDCLIIKDGKNSVNGVPQPIKAGVAIASSAPAASIDSKATASSRTQTSTSTAASRASSTGKTGQEMIQVTEARAVCFKKVKKGEKEAWWCVGPVMDTITPDDTEAQSLKYAGCEQPRKVIHNVRASYKQFNSADFVHYGYACGKPSMDADLNVDQVAQIKWPPDASFIQYKCPVNTLNRKKNCVVQ